MKPEGEQRDMGGELWEEEDLGEGATGWGKIGCTRSHDCTIAQDISPKIIDYMLHMRSSSALCAVHWTLLPPLIPGFLHSSTMDGQERKHRILMVSDFFFPNFGGVESYIYYLLQCLLKLGHKVVVMTHAYGKRSGVQYVTGGLKVYYVPWKLFLMQNTLPTLFLTFPIVRAILIREKISVVHGHQAFSTLCHEALMHARTIGY
ncbi:hypothetical protein GUJ93_ZPchr0014g46597 [Zizania palustris]|uniref:PIGA GPI anchor biosynthesis domain-containing protein n=1 Tax=Zizania palustris TaxID=103762 RepID=A0A8J5T9Y1_ZIZPA|nr:hypothetical protein GUJ93_ZPchr0014g46597 [Zizania palustris]